MTPTVPTPTAAPPRGATPPEQPSTALLDAVRRGDSGAVTGLLAGMSEQERRACVDPLTAERRRLRSDWSRWDSPSTAALKLAGAACHTGAAACARWLMHSDLRWTDAGPDALAGVLAHRDPAWLADLLHRLAEARSDLMPEEFTLLLRLRDLAGVPMPANEACVNAWTTHLQLQRYGSGGSTPASLVRTLREDPLTPVYVPLVLDLAGVNSPDPWTPEDNPAPDQTWPGALARLSDEGLLPRRDLVDRCVAALLRGGRPAELRFATALLAALNLTPQERTERTGDWVRLAADAPSSVAAHAQTALRALWEREQLPAAALAEASTGVLFRTEKKLVNAQLTLVDKAIRREPDSAPLLLPAVGQAFGHPDHTVQTRALRVVRRHLARADDPTRAELGAAADLLSPSLLTEAARLLGTHLTPPTAGPYTETLPPVPAPYALPPTPDTATEAAAEITAAMAHEPESAEFEHALDTLVRHAHRDRAALAAALQPLADHQTWLREPDQFHDSTHGLALAVSAVLGHLGQEAIRNAGRSRTRHGRTCPYQRYTALLDARVREAAGRLTGDRPLPLLLATPTDHLGRLDAAELLDRFAVHDRLGVTPAPLDLEQALLRVEHPEDPTRLTRRAREAGTEHGDRLAALLAAGPLAPPPLERRVAKARQRWYRSDEPAGDYLRYDVPALPALLDICREPETRRLADPLTPGNQTCYWHQVPPSRQLATCPGHRETLAAVLVPAAADAEGWGTSDACDALPLLAEAPGEAGSPGLHLLLAYGLTARDRNNRAHAVDALLLLAARRHLDPVLLAADLAELLDRGLALPNRVDDALANAADTGAHRTVWSVLAELLPALLARGPAPRALGALLATAADCAERTGIRGELPGLAELAARRGTTRVLSQARRLATALAGPEAEAAEPA